jgi:hypothetical protein
MLEDDVTSSGRPISLRALRSAVTRMPLWMLCWFVPFLLGLVLTLPWLTWFDGTLEHRYEAGSVVGSMDETFRFDHREGLTALRDYGGRAAAFLALFAMLVGVFSGGGWLQVFLERTTGHSVRRFLWGGARYFWRFLRVCLLGLLTLAFFSWLLFGWPWKMALMLLVGAEDGNLEVLESEWSAVLITWIQEGSYGLLVALLFAWGDYTRTRLALQDTFSALWAGLCTWGLFLLHPVRMLRPMVAILLVEAVVVLVIGRVVHGLDRGLGPESGLWSVFLLFLLGQLALLWRGISRGARYHAAAQVSKQLVPPQHEPDPWAGRVGGPGGPQYPIDMTDDYGVSV